MNGDDRGGLSAERFAQVVQDLSPGEVANLIIVNRGNLPVEAITKIMEELPREQGLKILEGIMAHFSSDVLQGFVGSLEDREKTERQEGMEIGAELINQVLRKEISPTEAKERLSSLPPIQFQEARHVLSLMSGINEALHRVTTGEATVELDLPPDEDGYYDRRCPSKDCGDKFKVFHEDWAGKDFEFVWCPSCGHRSRHDEFYTPTQREHIRYRGMHLVETEIGKEIPGGPFNIEPLQYEIPRDEEVEIEKTMQQRFQCEECACRYSSVGASFFCPACGHNSAASTFDDTVKTVCSTMDSLSDIRQKLTEVSGEDDAENLVRHICESALLKLVSSFQRFAEALFDSLLNRSLFNPRRNVFQNLTESSDLWRSAIGDGYDDMLTPSELSDIERFFQQRHLLAHQEGMVDQAYIDRSRDHLYAVGQRLVIRKEPVLNLADLVSKLADELRART